MTELLDITRNGRAKVAMNFSGFPYGNMTLFGSGTRFRHLPSHEKDDFLKACYRH